MDARNRRALYRRTVEALAIERHCQGKRYPTVLDFGCGTGWFSGYFRQRGSRVVGVEVQREALEVARRNHNGARVLWAWYGGGILPITTGSVDLVLAVGVVRSLMDRGPLHEAVEEWRRCLRPGGQLMLIETDNRALRRHIALGALRKTINAMGFETLSWYPVRKVSWLGLRLVKWGIFPSSSYPALARWELWARRRTLWGGGKRAFLGEFAKRAH